MSHSLTIICIYSVKKVTLTCNISLPAGSGSVQYSEFYIIFFCNKNAKHAQKALLRCLRRAWFADFGASESRLSSCWRTNGCHAVLCDWLFKITYYFPAFFTKYLLFWIQLGQLWLLADVADVAVWRSIFYFLFFFFLLCGRNQLRVISPSFAPKLFVQY